MNYELQIWFPGNAVWNNWIYFKTDKDNIADAIRQFKACLKLIKVDLNDMKPIKYDLWDREDSHHIETYTVAEGEMI